MEMDMFEKYFRLGRPVPLEVPGGRIDKQLIAAPMT
jgi:hypothetical protein